MVVFRVSFVDTKKMLVKLLYSPCAAPDVQEKAGAPVSALAAGERRKKDEGFETSTTDYANENPGGGNGVHAAAIVAGSNGCENGCE